MNGLAPLYGVVLAGGASRRMGRDKATLEYRGRSQVAIAFDLVDMAVAALIGVSVLIAPIEALRAYLERGRPQLVGLRPERRVFVNVRGGGLLMLGGPLDVVRRFIQSDGIHPQVVQEVNQFAVNHEVRRGGHQRAAVCSRAGATPARRGGRRGSGRGVADGGFQIVEGFDVSHAQALRVFFGFIDARSRTVGCWASCGCSAPA